MTDSIHEAVRRHAAAHPSAPALILPSGPVTYRDLVADADRLAGTLTRAGVRPGTVVPVLLPPSAELVTVLLAVLSCRAAYAALDRSWPSARLDAIAALLPGQLAVVADHAQYNPFAHRVVLGAAEPTVGPERPPVIVAADGTPAMVFFTSGSTGRPKAVLAPHRAICRLFDGPTFATFDRSTVMAQASAVPWDAFALELWGPLVSGGSCAVVTERPLTPPALRELTTRAALTTIFLTTSLFHLMVEEDVEAFAGLDTVLVGGEKLSRQHAERFLRRWPAIRLVNGYGPVESSVFVLTHEVGLDRPAGDVPLGVPVPRTQVRVFHGDRPAPPGEVGELVIAGDGLALCYVGDPELTAKKFVMLPVDGVATRCYRTGDLGRVDTDGVFHFHGRLDRQVKVHGHRLEPAGIEWVALRQPGVRRCVVLPRWDDGGACSGLALFYLRDIDGPSVAELGEVLRAELPFYSVPQQITEVTEFPLTATGKLDTARLLADPATTPAPAPAPAPASLDATGAQVAAEVKELLGMVEVDPTASLASLGVSSLTAIRLCTRLGRRFGRPVPPSQLVRTPTINTLAAWLDTSAAAPDPGAARKGQTAELTPMQHSFLLRHFADQTKVEHHCILRWAITGPVDPGRLATAVAEVHRRHGYLRSRYEAEDAALATPIDTGPPFEHLQAESAAWSVLNERLLAPFDLAAGVVWRAVLVSAPDRTVFGVAVHHVAFDGWSQHLLSEELSLAYAGLPVPGEPPEPAAVSAMVAGIADVADLPAQQAYWRATLAEIPTIQWPEPGGLGRAELEFRFSDADLAAAERVARTHHTGLLAVLLATTARVVFDETGQSDLGFGIPVSRRMTEELQLPIGCLVEHAVHPSQRLHDRTRCGGDLHRAGQCGYAVC